jgi:hypothetical protein
LRHRILLLVALLLLAPVLPAASAEDPVEDALRAIEEARCFTIDASVVPPVVHAHPC